MFKYVKCFLSTLLASVFLSATLVRKPHLTAHRKMGIRILAVSENRQQEKDLEDGAYEALILLEQHDQEMFRRVKRHIRIICLFSTNDEARLIPTGFLYFLCALRIPTQFPRGRLPIAVAGFLAKQSTLAKSKGCMAYYEGVKGAAVRDLCRREQTKIMHMLGDKTLGESPFKEPTD